MALYTKMIKFVRFCIISLLINCIMKFICVNILIFNNGVLALNYLRASFVAETQVPMIFDCEWASLSSVMGQLMYISKLSTVAFVRNRTHDISSVTICRISSTTSLPKIK